MDDKRVLSHRAASGRPAIEVNKVLKNTYMLLGATLLFSAVTATISVAAGMSHLMALVCMIGAFVTLFAVNRNADSARGLPWIFVFTGLLGASLGPMLGFYLHTVHGPQLVMQALGGTALVFFGLSGYVLVSRKDFSFMGGFLFVGLLVVIVAAIANLFLHMPALYMAISAAAILIFSWLILFDTSRIIHGGETNYIRATVALYLDVYNIFINLLALLGMADD